MTMLEELIPQLPPYIVVTTFLAYVIWSKFFNEGKLRLTNIDDLLDIFLITIILLASFFSVIFLSSLPTNLFSINPTFQLSISPSYMIIILAIYCVLILAVAKKKFLKTKEDLKNVYVFFLLRFYCPLSLLLLPVLISVYHSPLRVVLFSKFVGFFLYFISTGVIFWYLGKDLFDPKKLKLNKINKKLWATIPFIWILIYGSMSFLYPEVTTEDDIKSYTLINSPHAFENTEMNFYIKNWGKLGLVSLDYEDLPIGENSLRLNYREITDGGVFNYSRNIDKSGIENLRREYGIGDYRIDNESSSIFLKFDARKLEATRFISFTVQGKRVVDISKDFLIEKSKPVSCPAGNCSTSLIIVNNLNKSVGGNNIQLLKEELYPTTCKLINISGDYYTHKRQYPIEFEFEPDKNYERLRISSLGQEGIYIQMLSISGRVQRFDVEVFRIEGSSKANLILTFSCA